MSKFKVGDKVKVIGNPWLSTPIQEYGQIGSTGVVIEVDETGAPFWVSFGKNKSFWFKDDNSLELVKEPKPFNLEQFKSGVPAITRDGRVARFISVGPSSDRYQIEASADGFTHSQWFTIKGELWYDDESAEDLIYMQVTPEQGIPSQQPSKSLDEKRYEWFKTYMLSEITIDSLENEIIDCKSSEEFDAVVDKYSAKVTFNK